MSYRKLFNSVKTVCLLFVCNGCSTTLETVYIPVGLDGWKIGYYSDRKNHTLVEYVLQIEAANKWSRQLSIQFLEGITAPPEDVMQSSMFRIKSLCNELTWTVIQQDQTSVLYEWGVTNCPGQDTQHEITRLLQGNDGIHRIAYVEKVFNIPSGARKFWIDRFMKAYVVKGDQRVELDRPLRQANHTASPAP